MTTEDTLPGSHVTVRLRLPTQVEPGDEVRDTTGTVWMLAPNLRWYTAGKPDGLTSAELDQRGPLDWPEQT